MSISKKVKIYAVFQFITFISYFILGIAFILLTSNSNEWHHLISDKDINQGAFLSKTIILILSFNIPGTYGIASSTLVYISIIIIVFSWIVGLQIVRSKNRNLLDSLFLLFAFMPLISNILCLSAQVSSNTIAISYSINKQEEFKSQYAQAKKSKEMKLKQLKQELQNLKQK